MRVLRVADTGVGISDDQLGRVFEPFVQLDQTLTRPHEGVGLGLAISRDLARGMGGDLTVESTLGVGSTFTLTLPAAYPAPLVDQATANAPSQLGIPGRGGE
jgi:signal transduction histidine kinase